MESISNITNSNILSQSKRGLIISTLIVSMMVFLRDLGIVPFSPVFFIIVVTLICISLPYKYLRTFSFFYIVGGSGVHGIAYIPLIAALIFKSKNKNRYQIIFAVIILIFELIHYASYSFITETNQFIIFALYIIFFFFLLFENNENNEDICDDIQFYIIGTAFALFVILMHSFMAFGIEDTLLGYQRIGTGFEEEELEGVMRMDFNANYMAYYSIVAFALALFTKKSFRTAWVKVVIMSILVLGGVLSSSRTWLLTFGVTIALYFLLSRIRGRFVFLLVAFFIFVGAWYYSSVSSVFYARFADRIEGEDISTAGERMAIFKEYNGFLKNHPDRIIYGTGALYYHRICQIPKSVHNGTQQLVVCYGVLGVLIFVWCGILFHNIFINKRKHKFWEYVPFIMCAIFVQSIQLINPVSLLLPFTASLLPIKLKQVNN